MLLTPAGAKATLPLEGEQYAVVFGHGGVEVGWYAPRGVDEQEPHARDEAYVIVSGAAGFSVNGEADCQVGSGDLLFVAAGRQHRFFAMSEDFGTWVLFFGASNPEEPGARS